MNTHTSLPASQSGIRWLWIAAGVILLDQLTKFWVVSTLALEQTVPVLPVFSIHRTFNEGAAWSMFANAGGAQRWVFSALAVGVSIGLVVWLRRLALASHALLITGLTLILGGAIGNVIDRLRLGHVIDFLLFFWNSSRFPAFNIADSAITVGAGLVILDAILEGRRERQARKQVS
ncbi:MAG TPA: signal peptidase II [Steroidobacteraceae bacterium]|nr:signal peptidase II [Steroidobacteraceae bacterium]